MTKIWAHRGASGYAPENTIEAFQLALEQNADGVELDVQLSKDGELVVIHDETLERVSGQKGYVKDYSLSQLKELNVNKTVEGFQTVRIPTLEEVYDLLKGTGLLINVEIKSSLIWYPEIEEKVLSLTQKKGMEEQVLYSSFNHQSVRKIKELNPETQTGLLYGDVLCDIKEYARAAKVDALHPVFCHRYMEKVWKDYCDTGLRLHVWTVNSKEDMLYFIQNKIDAIITNYPDMAYSIRSNK